MSRVLIVVDDRATQSTYTGLLERKNGSLCVIDTSELAVQEVSDIDYDLIVLDLNASESERALHALNRFRCEKPTTPVLLLVGRDHHEAEELLGSGLCELIAKPFFAEDFVAHARKLMLQNFSKLRLAKVA